MESSTTWQDTATALGTLLAVAVALAVAITEITRSIRLDKETKAAQRIATAGLVSAWVEEHYEPNESGSAYIRFVSVHLANEANEPVFRVTASIGVGLQTRPIGPLAVPAPIPVLPPRKTLTWDITLPLRAHDDTQYPCVEMGFSDSSDRRWLRDFDGSLRETTGQPARLLNSEDAQSAERQMGRLGDPENPIAVAAGFLNVVSQSEANFDDLALLVAPEARGWATVTQEDLTMMKDDLSDYGLAGFVHYPAPRVAYVKILPEALQLQVLEGGDSLVVDAKIITLTYIPERGWRVFSYGSPTEADRILFPHGSLLNG